VPNWDALADIDVELVVRDLLSAEWKTHVESFRRGPDGGIDLRVAGPSGPPLNLSQDNRVIVQVKHYPNATLSRLRSAFAKEARRNLIGSNVRYIPVTTAKLSPETKRQISEVFYPHVRETDVIGREDLEALLARHSDIERRHLRLWLTDTVTLEAILHSRQRWLQNQTLQEIRQQASLLVPTRHLKLASSILDSEGAVILAGPPGVGKTSTALLLLANYLKSGWDLLVAVEDLGEIEGIRNNDKRQLVYYDDFLGSSLQTAFLSGKNEDRRIVGLLENAKINPNLRLVLTTREYVLSAARRVHPRLSDEQVDLTRVLVDASELDAFERAEVLYRHIYFSACRPILDGRANSRRLWLPVLMHPAFNPRLVKMYVAAASRDAQVRKPPSVTEFARELRRTLDDPAELWHSIYDDHLSETQRQLLITCATCPEFVILDDLLTLTSGWVSGEPNVQSKSQWRTDLRALDGDFLSITTITVREITGSIVSFANTSIASYVLLRLRSDVNTILGLLSHAVLFEQVERLWVISLSHFDLSGNYLNSDINLEAEYRAEREQEIFEDLPLVPISEIDIARLRDEFKNATLRTFGAGAYSRHPSLGVIPERWLRMSAPLALRLPQVYDIANILKIDDNDFADSMVRPFIDYVANNRGEPHHVLAAVRAIYSGTLTSWSRHKTDIRSVADGYFLNNLVDGQDFLDTIEYLRIVQAEELLDELRPKLVEAIEGYAFTEAPLYRIMGSASTEIDLIITSFRQAADIIGLNVSKQLTGLRAALAEMVKTSDVKPFFPPVARNSEPRPARAERGDVSRSAALSAAGLLSKGDRSTGRTRA